MHFNAGTTKKTANLHRISNRCEPFLIIDNCRYGTKLALNVNADIAPFNGAIWHECSGQRWHQSIKKQQI